MMAAEDESVAGTFRQLSLSPGPDGKRKRPRFDIGEDEDTKDGEKTFINHPTLYFEDGNVILKCSVGRTLFRVHRSIVGRHSPVLGELFTSADDRKEVYLRGCLLITLNDDMDDVEMFLNVLYDGLHLDTSTLSIETFPLIAAVLRMSTKYGVERPRAEIIERLRKEWPYSLDEHVAKATAFRERLRRSLANPFFPPKPPSRQDPKPPNFFAPPPAPASAANMFGPGPGPVPGPSAAAARPNPFAFPFSPKGSAPGGSGRKPEASPSRAAKRKSFDELYEALRGMHSVDRPDSSSSAVPSGGIDRPGSSFGAVPFKFAGVDKPGSSSGAGLFSGVNPPLFGDGNEGSTRGKRRSDDNPIIGGHAARAPAVDDDAVVHPASVIALLQQCGYSSVDLLAPLFYDLSTRVWQFGGPGLGHNISSLSPADIERLILGLHKLRVSQASALRCPGTCVWGSHPQQDNNCRASVDFEKWWEQSVLPKLTTLGGAGMSTPIEDWSDLITSLPQLCSGTLCDVCSASVVANAKETRSRMWDSMAETFALRR